MNEFRTPIKYLWQLLNKSIKEAKVYILGYRSYTALLTQSGTDAPVATVLENTLGNIVWTYDSTGVYNATLIGGFVENKSVLFKSTETSTNIKQIFYWGNENTLWFEQIDQTSAYIDGLYGEAIEIRVYN